jgi:hypothetical protein
MVWCVVELEVFKDLNYSSPQMPDLTYLKVLPVIDLDVNFFEGRIMLQNYKINSS